MTGTNNYFTCKYCIDWSSSPMEASLRLLDHHTFCKIHESHWWLMNLMVYLSCCMWPHLVRNCNSAAMFGYKVFGGCKTFRPKFHTLSTNRLFPFILADIGFLCWQFKVTLHWKDFRIYSNFSGLIHPVKKDA